MIACGAAWDQRTFKQTVIRGYAPWLTMARPILNGINRIFSGPRLPRIGATLSNAFASHLAFAFVQANDFGNVINRVSRVARWRGIELLTLGFAASDPRLIMVRKTFPGREYRSRLYVVRWPGIGRPAAELDDRVIAPEVALL